MSDPSQPAPQSAIPPTPNLPENPFGAIFDQMKAAGMGPNDEPTPMSDQQLMSFIMASLTQMLPGGRWAVSPDPTNNLYMRFAFDYEDGATSVIRELGVFVGTKIKPSVIAATPGKVYFAPSDLESPGTLLSLQRIPKITRSANTRQAFEFVLTL